MNENVKAILSLGVIAIAAPFLWWSWTDDDLNPPKQEMSQKDKDLSEARYACQQSIAANLHDPESAEWEMGSDNWYATWPARVNGSTITVEPSFRVHNALGTKILSQWSCVIDTTDNSWRLVSLEEL
ncbi:hypothetical protein PAF17_10540 [Paracoccus sp. Z330]|uniref:Surface antigen domain-containing protein n=1 Tax=Paracoccus onchidii TaxID=3017813 RepID=A0ABT4ZG39_9RHOB|nr:hypothetical protein [Paracoccus onchidii]MDB6177938.1 hypothetical protein [Paracoccus onchidii]